MAAPASRPFKNLSGDSIADLFRSAQKSRDRGLAEMLLAEITVRTTRTMRALRPEVESWLERPGDGPLEERATEAGAASDVAVDYVHESRAELFQPESVHAREPQTYEPDAPGGAEHAIPQAIPNSTARFRDRGAAPGTPQTWLPRMSTELATPADLTHGVRERYVWALAELIAEQRKKGAASSVLPVFDGTSIGTEVDRSGYQFSFEGDAENLFEGASIVLVVGSMKIPGRIFGLIPSERLVLVTLETDLGPKISGGELRVDSTAMLEQLAKRLRDLDAEPARFNAELAEAVLSNGALPLTSAVPILRVPPGGIRLNDEQREAAEGALAHSLFYIWGPPGTGKTVSLASIVFSLFHGGKKTLICSNTNQAVDQVLLKLCRAAKGTSMLEEGRIIRIGRIEHPDLKQPECAKYVSLPEIVARLGSNLTAEREQVERELQRTAAEQERLQRLIQAFVGLEKLIGRRAILVEERRKHMAVAETCSEAMLKAANEILAAKVAIDGFNKAGFVRRAFMPNPEALKAQIGAAERIRVQSQAEVKKAQRDGNQVSAEIEQVDTALAPLRSSVAGENRSLVEQRLAQLQAARGPLSERLTQINKQLADLEERVLREAMVLGATVTKLFLSPNAFAGFDTVVIDEASMVMAPALYHAAGLAKERVVISGDFRQLPPIVQTSEQAIFDVLGRDVFDLAGIAAAVAARSTPPRMVMLRQQHRMPAAICDLVSGPMYDGKLVTATRHVASEHQLPAPFAPTVVIVDTSELHPFIGEDNRGSKFNLIHALVVRNASVHLASRGFTDFGVCTTYRAQTKLLRQMLKGAKIDVNVGTVHRYQGDEKELMIVDMPESFGCKVLGPFSQGESPDNTGPRVTNVAITRAKRHLVFVLNVRFLDAKLPNNAIVREVLFRAQSAATVVDAREILALSPTDWDLRSTFGLPLPKMPERGLFRQREFTAAVRMDLLSARRSVVIFSGFITDSRVASYGDTFRGLTARGVRIRCVVRPVQNSGSTATSAAAIAALKALGCVVDLRAFMHEKLVMIDDEVVWFGSLNPLSHTSQTSEIMLRTKSEETAAQIAQFLSLPEQGKSDFVEKENPQCEECGADSVLNHGKFGNYFTCSKPSCSWKANPGRGGRNFGRNAPRTPGSRLGV